MDANDHSLEQTNDSSGMTVSVQAPREHTILLSRERE